VPATDLSVGKGVIYAIYEEVKGKTTLYIGGMNDLQADVIEERAKDEKTALTAAFELCI
jgi:hypothetical protein